METSIEGVFACGNVLHVHDLVDFVSEEAKRAGRCVADYLKGDLHRGDYLNVVNGKNINYTVPQKISADAVKDNLTMFMRVNNIYHDKKIVVRAGDTVVAEFKRKHLAPSEMEKILIKRSLLENVKEDLVVSLEEA